MAPKRRRSIAWTVMGSLAAGGLLFSAFLWVAADRWRSQRREGRGKEVIVDVPLGTGPARLSRLLADAEVIDHPDRFAWMIRLRGAAPRIRAGRYRLRDNLSPDEVLGRVLRVGRRGALRITIPEGKNLFQISDLLAEEGIVGASQFRDAAQDPLLLAELSIPGDSAEGYLFPDTYDLLPGTAADQIVRRFKRNFDQRVGPIFGAHEAALRRLSEVARLDARGVLVLASLVEAEARLAEERPRVAAVFLNRLTLPTFPVRLLNSDPAVAYGCLVAPAAIPSCRGYNGRPGGITESMLQDDRNPYNTYKKPRLPPGPICNPGVASIGAVLEPQGEDLYFMARGDGSHAFAATLEEHTENVRRYRSQNP